MRVFIHQPHFLPWLPYFFRVSASDQYLALDSAQFRKGYFHNRTIVSNGVKKKVILTVPVSHSEKGALNETKISRDARALKHIYSQLSGLSKSVHSRDILPILDLVRAAIRDPNSSISSMNLTLIEHIMNELGIKCEVVATSRLVKEIGTMSYLPDALAEFGVTEIFMGTGMMSRLYPTEVWTHRNIVPYECKPSAAYLAGHELRKFGLSVVSEIDMDGAREVGYSLERCCDVHRLE